MKRKDSVEGGRKAQSVGKSCGICCLCRLQCNQIISSKQCHTQGSMQYKRVGLFLSQFCPPSNLPCSAFCFMPYFLGLPSLALWLAPLNSPLLQRRTELNLLRSGRVRSGQVTGSMMFALMTIVKTYTSEEMLETDRGDF